MPVVEPARTVESAAVQEAPPVQTVRPAPKPEAAVFVREENPAKKLFGGIAAKKERNEAPKAEPVVSALGEGPAENSLKQKAMFAALAVCGAVPLIFRMFLQSTVGSSPRQIANWYTPIMWIAWLLFVAGIVLSLAWLRRNSITGPDGTASKRILPCLAMVLIIMIGLWLVFFLMRTRWAGHFMVYNLSVYSMLAGAFVACLIGLFALFQARSKDRRWLAVYILGMALGIMSLVLWYTNVAYTYYFETINTFVLSQFAIATLAGLAGAGAVLFGNRKKTS